MDHPAAPTTSATVAKIERPVHGTPADDWSQAWSQFELLVDGFAGNGLRLDDEGAHELTLFLQPDSLALLSLTTPLTLASISLARMARCHVGARSASLLLAASELFEEIAADLQLRQGSSDPWNVLLTVATMMYKLRDVAIPAIDATYVVGRTTPFLDDSGVVAHERAAPHAWLYARRQLGRRRWRDHDFPTDRPAPYAFNPGAERLFDGARFAALRHDEELVVRPPWTRSYQEPISAFANGVDREVVLEHEADNPYDRYAVAVVGRFRTALDAPPDPPREAMLGHLPRDLAYRVHELVEDGACVTAEWLLAWYRTTGLPASWRLLLAVDREGEARPLPLRSWQRDEPTVVLVDARARSRKRAATRR